MENISELYRRKFERKLEQFNKPMEFPDYLVPLLPHDFIHIKVAELGAGPICTIGGKIKGWLVEIFPSDILANEYKELWKGREPLVPVEYQDMESLTYDDNSFDIVHCVNALDHTPDYKKAISEMKRVCKPNGYIYMRHGFSQKNRFRGHHYHNIEELDLSEFETRIIDNGDYKKNFIEHIWRKT